jgi:prevent-host-death family protein
MQDATPERDQVGVRELRDHLSQYLDRVKAGTEVVVTEHGLPIAYLVPRPRSQKLADLIAARAAGSDLLLSADVALCAAAQRCDMAVVDLNATA